MKATRSIFAATLMFAFAISVALTSTASADLITQTISNFDFTTAEGFTNGGVNGQNGFFGQSSATLHNVNTSGTGTLDTTVSGGFARFRYGSSLGAETVAVGDMILVEMNGLTITADGNTGNTAAIGLSQYGQFTGNGDTAIGSQLTNDGTNLYLEDDAFGVDTAGRVDTGFNIGDTFDWSVKLTAETAGGILLSTYTVDHIINGTSILNQTGQAANFGTADAFGNEARAMFQDQDDPSGATYTIDGVGFSTIAAVPEPSSLALLGLVGGLVALRRRK